MRQLLEDVLIVYRQEADNLLTIVAPAAILGPVLVIISAASPSAALVSVPVLLLLYLGTYATCVRASGAMLRNLAPDPMRALIDVLISAPSILIVAIAPILLLTVVMCGAIFVAEAGFILIGAAMGLIGIGAAIHWATQHPYDYSLLLAFDVSPDEAVRAGSNLAIVARRETLVLLAMLAAPLAVVGLISLWAGIFLGQPAGAGIFLVALALWLPFPAIGLTFGCDRLVSETAAQHA
jgi:hypothetical protein